MAYNETYRSDPAAALVGMVADTETAEIISRTVETSGGIGFGVPVKQGTADRECDVVGDGVTEVIGITVRSQATDPASADEYPLGDTAALLRKGVIWVTVTDAGGVDPGDPVWVKLADGTFSNADVGSDGSIKLAGCRWESTAANGALAKMRVDLNVPAVAGAS